MPRMFTAVKAGNLEEIKGLVESGFDINKKDDDGNAALHHAASNRLTEIVIYLVEHGAKVNCKNQKNQTALHRACKASSLDIVEYLVKQSANIKVKDRKNKTALHPASKYGSLEIVACLVENGAEINCESWKKNTALLYASKSGSLETVKYLVARGADINHQNRKGDASLHRAVDSGSLEKVWYLTNYGCDIRCENAQNQTALHRAVHVGSLPIVKCLIENGATITIVKRQKHGRAETALLNEACRKGNKQIVFCLLEKGVIKDPYGNDDSQGRSLLSIACNEGNSALVRSLREWNVQLQRERGLICGNDEIARILNESVKHRQKIKILKEIDNKELTQVGFPLKYCPDNSLLIAKGSMGTSVHVAILGDDNEVAVKRMLTVASEDVAQNENRILGLIQACDSPFVVRYRKFFRDRTFTYLVLDLCEESLQEHVRAQSIEHLKKHGPRMIKEILTGLEYLHDQGILHRDLKPTNILVDVEGKMRLADFGISRILEDDETSLETNAKGTEGWMPAEVIESMIDGVVGHFNRKSDIQAAGMIAFFILTNGDHPFGSRYERMGNILSGKPVNLRMLEDRDARRFVSWLIAHNINDRPYAHEALNHTFVAQDVETLSEPKVNPGSDNEMEKSSGCTAS